eukprot:jgi/Tetstr1/462409/TSEL_007415.t1
MDGLGREKGEMRGAGLLLALAVLVVGWPSCLMLGLGACPPSSRLLGGSVRVRHARIHGASSQAAATLPLADADGPAHLEWQTESGEALWPAGIAVSPMRRRLLTAAFEGKYRAGARPPYSYEYTADRASQSASAAPFDAATATERSAAGPAPFPSAAPRATAPPPVIRSVTSFAEPPQSVRGLPVAGCCCAARPELVAALEHWARGETAAEACRVPFAQLPEQAASPCC